MESTWWTALSLGAGYVVSLLLVRSALMRKRSQPVATVAWIMVIVSVPFLGGLLFLIFGINQVERRLKQKVAASRDLADSLPDLTNYVSSPEELNDLQSRLARLATVTCGLPVTAQNRIEILGDAIAAQDRIEAAIKGATDCIHLEYYIWRPDRTGRQVRDLLIDRARQGVTVRFLYDGIGSIGLSRKFLNPMREAGIRVASFLPGKSLRERWSLNLRSHRKIVVVDGRLGFTGGMNIGDEYVGRRPQIAHWRDTHLELHGPTVLQLQQVFAEDWYYATDEEVTSPSRFPVPSETGNEVAQVVSGGPVGESRPFHALMFTAINEARRRVTLTTSYFVPTAALVMALETAALRGVDVRLLVPSQSTYYWTLMAGRSYYESLLRSGVTIHEYTKGMLHSKTLTVDGCWSLVGTPNFDARSLNLNFEVAVAMFGSRIARELEEHYEADLLGAVPILSAEWDGRPLRKVFIENFFRLFSPLM
ncbi:MAG: cardiolipin synthase [Planctomycetaceae bacterium]